MRNIFVPFIAEPNVVDSCASSPCGPNARCDNGVCTCLPEYQGDPYVGCRPECVLNTDCPLNRACIRNKCVDPCPGTCGLNAECRVYNHVPMCSCPSGMVGNAFVQCNILQGTTRRTLYSMLDLCLWIVGDRNIFGHVNVWILNFYFYFVLYMILAITVNIAYATPVLFQR